MVWKVALINFINKAYSLLSGFFHLTLNFRPYLDNIRIEAQLDIKLLQDGLLKFHDQILLVAPFYHIWILQLKINFVLEIGVPHYHI